MSIVVSENEKSAIISVPLEELEKLGLSVGDEVEVYKNENDEIVLRPKQIDKSPKIEDATEKVFDRWDKVFVELAKRTDEK